MLVPTRAAIVAVTALLALPLLAAPAHAVADEPSPSAATLRAQADTIATRYFDALARFESLDREIIENKHVIDELAVRARAARAAARTRALSAYRSSSAQLSSIMGSDNALNAARRVQLIDRVNMRDQTIYRRVRTVAKELNAQRRALEADHRQQSDALEQLREQTDAMERKLALAQQEEQAAAAQAAAAAATAQAVTALAAAPIETQATAPPAPPPTVPVTTRPPPVQVVPTPPPSYVGNPGGHPMHNDPFLTCVRARESSGNYSVVNPAGPYLGAYQFLQSTWNATANHAGRNELVGVPPNVATPYDQDDLAWALYQWRGAGPWGGSCQ